jgi:putative ABC transport system ATP-binding protein
VLQPVLVLMILLLVGLAFASVLTALKTWVAEVLQRRAFVETVARLAYRLPRADFARSSVRDGAHLVHRFFDLFTVQKAAATLLLGGIDVVLAASVGMLVLAFYHPVLLAFDIALVLCVVLNIGLLGRGGIESSIEESSQKYQMAGFLSEVASARHAFRDRGGSGYAEEQIDLLAVRWLEARSAHFRVVMRQVIGALGTQAIASAALLGLGGWLVIERELTLGQLVAAELIVTSVVSTFTDLGKHIETYYDLVTGLHKLDTLVSVPTERDAGPRS